VSTSAAVRVFGVIPAAGRSSRMGAPKQLLPFGDSTILGTVIAGALAGGLDGLVVVTNPTVNAALGLSRDTRFETVVVDRPEAEMLDSVLVGIGHACEAFEAACAEGASGDGVLVLPGDMPSIPAGLVRDCTREYRLHPESIVVGAWEGRAGHPIILPLCLREELEGLRGQGLKGILKSPGKTVRQVEAGSVEIMADIDTLKDYEARHG
jgi:molybdenum cofactor cytidylyltransferase